MIEIKNKKEDFQVVIGNYVLIDWNVYIVHQTERGMYSLVNISTGKRYTDEKTALELKRYIEKDNGKMVSNKEARLTFEY